MPAIPFRSCFDKQVALWILRSFSPALGRERFFTKEGYRDRDLSNFLKLPADFEQLDDIIPQLDRMHAALEKASRVGLTRRAKDNFDRLAEMRRCGSKLRR